MLSTSDVRKIDDASAVRSAASKLGTATTAVKTTADAVARVWGELAGAYHAPEQNDVLDATDAPVTSATSLKTNGATVKSALDAYSDQLDELKTRRDQLVTDIMSLNDKIAAAKATVEDEGEYIPYAVDMSTGNPIPSGAANDLDRLYGDEEDLLQRMVQFQSDVDDAERDCANKIGAITCAPVLKEYGSTSVDDPNVYGMRPEDWKEGIRSGDIPFNKPDGWTNGGQNYVTGRVLGRGLNSIKDGFSTVWSLAGFGDEGRTEFNRSAFGKFMGSFDKAFTENIGSEKFKEGWSELGSAGFSFIGGPAWSHDPAGAFGDALFNVGGLLVPVGGWAKGGSSLVLKGGKLGKGVSAASDTSKLFDGAGMASKLDRVHFDGPNPQIWQMKPLGVNGRGIAAEGLTFAERAKSYPELQQLTKGFKTIDFADAKTNTVVSVKSIDPSLPTYANSPSKFYSTLSSYASKLDGASFTTAKAADGSIIRLRNPTKELNIVFPDSGLSPAQAAKLIDLEKAYPNIKFHYTEVPR